MVDLRQVEENREKVEAATREATFKQAREDMMVANATRYAREISDLASALASLNEFTAERGNWPEIERQKRAVVLRLNILLGIE
jgi:hypothetical protein